MYVVEVLSRTDWLRSEVEARCLDDFAHAAGLEPATMGAWMTCMEARSHSDDCAHAVSPFCRTTTVHSEPREVLSVWMECMGPSRDSR